MAQKWEYEIILHYRTAKLTYFSKLIRIKRKIKFLKRVAMKKIFSLIFAIFVNFSPIFISLNWANDQPIPSVGDLKIGLLAKKQKR